MKLFIIQNFFNAPLDSNSCKLRSKKQVYWYFIYCCKSLYVVIWPVIELYFYESPSIIFHIVIKTFFDFFCFKMGNFDPYQTSYPRKVQNFRKKENIIFGIFCKKGGHFLGRFPLKITTDCKRICRRQPAKIFWFFVSRWAILTPTRFLLLGKFKTLERKKTSYLECFVEVDQFLGRFPLKITIDKKEICRRQPAKFFLIFCFKMGNFDPYQTSFARKNSKL